MNKEIAAKKIQSLWRGFSTRTHFKISKLDSRFATDDKTFLVGNDPKILNLSAEASNKIALIGTSGLRSLQLGLELSSSNGIPKIVIVDISSKVVEFWRKLRNESSALQNPTHSQFTQFFSNFIEKNKELYRDLPADIYTKKTAQNQIYENQDPILYFNRIVDVFGVDKVLAAIKNTSVLHQSWTNPEVFTKLRNILKLYNFDKIIAYSSNIAQCVTHSSAKDLCKSIENLSPSLSIFTDYCPEHHIPENFMLLEDTNALEIEEKILTSTSDEILVFYNEKDLLSYLANSMDACKTVKFEFITHNDFK